MKHADLTIMFQEGVRLGRHGVNSDAYANFDGDRPRSSWHSRIGRAVRHWLDRHHQRRALSLLDDRLLKDIGLSQIDAAQEVEKPFWQL